MIETDSTGRGKNSAPSGVIKGGRRAVRVERLSARTFNT
jgi:hypothetical protein